MTMLAAEYIRRQHTRHPPKHKTQNTGEKIRPRARNVSVSLPFTTPQLHFIPRPGARTIFPHFVSSLFRHIFDVTFFVYISSLFHYYCFPPPPPLPPSINPLAHFPSSLSSSISLTCPSSKSPNSTFPYLTRWSSATG